MFRQLNGHRGDFGAARGVRLRCLDRARPDGDHLQTVIGELDFRRGFAGVNRTAHGHFAAVQIHLDAVGGQGGIKRGGQARGQVFAQRRVRDKHGVGGELLNELANRLVKRLASAIGQDRRVDQVHLGRAQLAKRRSERLDALPCGNGVDFRLSKRQPKQFPSGFAQGSVFVFGND